MLTSTPLPARALVAATAIALSSLVPLSARADTMEGVITDFSNGNAAGGFSLTQNNGRDSLGFAFQVSNLRVEGVWWMNMRWTGGHPTASSTESLGCPRKMLCTIVMKKTRVRVEYKTRDGDRIATNIIALDPDGPNSP